ncbi:MULTISPECIES: hypothetical protein [unclassified Paraflavitalea]|uniref:hypothetical protein n=1 Tax=unclassified Paraflavitalea TaxID=2798305 RepID=UPI003D34D666
MLTLEFEGVSFNVDHYSKMDLDSFVNTMEAHVFEQYAAEDRIELLKTVHRLIKSKANQASE